MVPWYVVPRICLGDEASPSRKEVTKMLFFPGELGQGLVEYALILAFVALVVIVTLILLGPSIGNVFSNLIHNI